MSFLEELKEDYAEVSILTEDIKEDIKQDIKDAVRVGNHSTMVVLEASSVQLCRNAIKYAKEELGLDVFREDTYEGIFHVSGWC